MGRFVDLHTHSSASDGTDSPSELVRLAALAGLSAVALTDHDTLAGLDEAAEAGERYGISVIRGCEIASGSAYGEVHLLGLWVPERAPALETALLAIRDGRNTRNERILAKLRAHGLDITMDDVLAEAEGETVARPHIARALVAGGFVPSVREAFDSMIGEGRPMYVPRAIPDPGEALTMLRRGGAVTVLAHPMLIKAPFSWLEALVQDLAAQGLDAIEVWHGEHGATETRVAAALAKRQGLALSGGSDYHGWVKPSIRLGTGKGRLRIPWKALETLRALCRSRNGAA